jgi:hypothetical protein
VQPIAATELQQCAAARNHGKRQRQKRKQSISTSSA